MTEEDPNTTESSDDARDDPQQRIDDWLQSWDDGTLGSLEDKQPDPLLVKHFDDLTKGRQHLKILVPMCGTCIDMKWFAEQGHDVVGIDVSEVAARLFFKQHGISHSVHDVSSVKGKLYKSDDSLIKFYVVDFFLFDESIEGLFDVVWDTGSLGSTDIRDRHSYMEALKRVIKDNCIYLLETLVFDKNKFEGPPYCFYEEDIKEIFGNSFSIRKVDEHDYDVPEEEADMAETFREIGFQFHFYCLERN